MATSRADDWRGESQRWLHRNGFQFDGYYNGDKTLLTPDVLIDDRPVTLEAMAAKGVTVLHPDHAYCTAAPGQMFHWRAAVPLILGLLRACDPELDSRRRPKRHPLMGAGHP